jgi:hypothetical protein
VKTGECAASSKYSLLIFVEKIYKMQHLEGSGTPVLYTGRTVLKGQFNHQNYYLLCDPIMLIALKTSRNIDIDAIICF